MVFHPLHCVLSSKTINKVADDIIDIALIASQKDKIRNSLILERLKTSNKHAIVTPYEINQVTTAMSKRYVKPEVVASSLKRVAKNLDKQYKQLANIFEKLR